MEYMTLKIAGGHAQSVNTLLRRGFKIRGFKIRGGVKLKP